MPQEQLGGFHGNITKGCLARFVLLDMAPITENSSLQSAYPGPDLIRPRGMGCLATVLRTRVGLGGTPTFLAVLKSRGEWDCDLG